MAEVDERAPPSAGKDVSPQRQMWTPRSEERAKRRCKGQNTSRKKLMLIQAFAAEENAEAEARWQSRAEVAGNGRWRRESGFRST